MKYQVIVADPPWLLKDSLKMSDVKRGASTNYPVLSVDQICALPVKKVADSDGCILALWVLGSMLDDGLKVMKAWGFEQKQVYVWVKTKKEKSLTNLVLKNVAFKVGDWLLGFGMGRLFRQSHEICLIGINDTKIYTNLDNKSQRSVCFEENRGHSVKPENLQKSLEIMFPNSNKLEMFARRKRTGWTVIGHDVSNGKDIVASLRALENRQ